MRLLSTFGCKKSLLQSGTFSEYSLRLLPMFYFHFSSFTELPHLAGTEQNLLLAKKIQTQWQKFGLDSAKLVHYDVLLSYPNKTNANYISVLDEHGVEVM